MYSYDLKCTDKVSDLHEIITKEFNPILVMLSSKYYKSKCNQRPLVTYYNEEDSAKVQVIYSDISLTPEETIVSALFNLRNLFVDNKIDFNTFRQEVGRLMIMAHTSVPTVYPYLEKMLSALGCTIVIKPSPRNIIKRREYENLNEYMRLMSSLDLKNVVSLKIVLKNKGKTLLNQKIRIQVETIVNSNIKTLEFDIKTNKNGEAIIPIKRFSKIRIILPYSIRQVRAVAIPRDEKVSVKQIDNNQVELIIGKENIELRIDIEKKKHLLTYILAGIFGLLTLLMLTILMLI